MLSQFSFCCQTLPSTIVISRGIGQHIFPSCSSASPSFQFLRQFVSFNKYYRRPGKPPPLHYQKSLCVGFGTSNFRQMRSSGGRRRRFAGIRSNKRLYRTHFKAAKATMLRRLATWLSYRNFRLKQINQDFDLGLVFRMLDTIFFNGLLHDRVKLRWKDSMEKPEYLSRTTMVFDARRGLCAEIEIVKPLTHDPWTPTMILERYNALLYGMTLALSEIYPYSCNLFQQSNNRAVRGRRSGYGSPFKRLLREVKKEAKRISKGLPRPWKFHSWKLCSCRTFDIGLSI